MRELREELGLSLADCAAARFTSFTHDFGFAGVGMLLRVYFEIRLICPPCNWARGPISLHRRRGVSAPAVDAL